MSGVRDLRTVVRRSCALLLLVVGEVGDLGPEAAAAVEAMCASSSSRRVLRAEIVAGVTVLRSEDVSEGGRLRWRKRVRAWTSFTRWERGRSSDARRKMVRL